MFSLRPDSYRVVMRSRGSIFGMLQPCTDWTLVLDSIWKAGFANYPHESHDHQALGKFFPCLYVLGFVLEACFVLSFFSYFSVNS